MAEERVTRRLAAILAADVVGYSRLTAADEERTIARLRALRSELIDPSISSHHGRVVKRTGDGALIAFHSVVDAVRCAIEVQNGMVERNAGLPPDRRIEFRVGIHLGDVMVEEDGDLMGDGVNIAARIESLAEPGGIYLSQAAYDQVRDKMPYDFLDLGKRELKNIARPIQIFALSSKAISVSSDKTSSATPLRAVRRRGSRWSVLVVGLAFALIMAGWFSWRTWAPQTPTLSGATDRLATVPRLSIVVLPFENLSGDPEQEYFADSMTDDLTTDLSHLSDSFVIARNTAFTYKGKAVDVKQIGRELGVRYVLEGSVRRVDEKITVNAQLISAETGAHVWADRFDGERSRLGELQVVFVARLANSLGVQLINAESLRAMRERQNNPDAVDLAMRGWAVYNQQGSPANTNEAIGYFERALQLDPQQPQALLGLAQALAVRASNYWSVNRDEDLDRANHLVAQIQSAQPDSAPAHNVKAILLGERGQWEASIAESEAAIGDDRNLAAAYAFAGFRKVFIGRAAEGFAGVETALRLSPRDPQRYLWELFICHLHAHLAHWDQAIEWCGKSIADNANFWFAYVDLAAANAFTGRDTAAQAAVAELLRLMPGYTVQKWLNMKWSDNPTFIREYQRIAQGLRKAGLSEGEVKSN